MFRNLDQNSPRFVSPDDNDPFLTKPLFLHQRADIHAMMQLEDSHNNRIIFTENETFDTRIGMLCDKPGAGKSYTVLALLMHRPKVNNPSIFKNRSICFGGMTLIERTRSYSKVLDTSVILAPRGTLRQWESYIEDMTSCAHTDYQVFSTIRDKDIEDIYKNRYKIVVMGEASYKKLTMDAQRVADTLFQRLIVDEADSIQIPNCKVINAAFTWLVTATPQYLLNGLAPTVAFRRFFDTRIGNDSLFNYVMVNSNSTFVDESLNLPMYTEETALVTRSRLMSNIRTFVSDDVMGAINACDYASAIVRLGCPTVQSDDGIIAAVTSKIAGEIESLKNLMISAPTGTIPAITFRIRDMEKKIALIKDRVRESNCCPIGMDAIEVKACVPCCQNAFEFANLMKAVESSGKCPLCKAMVIPKDVIVMTSPGNGASTSSSPTVATHTSKARALETILRKIFNGNNRSIPAKVLVFSNWDMDMPMDVADSMGLRYKEVKGNTSVINDIINQFTTGDLSMLLLNGAHFGAGLNLQVATHIICLHKLDRDRYTQLIGRAQRPVRSSSLKVIHIKFTDE